MYKNSLLHACVLVPKFDEFNNPYTVVYHANGVKKVNLTPHQLLDQELNESGSSLRGAKEAAKAMLGSSSIHPILIPMRSFISVWFPSESTRNDTHIYFELHAIVKVIPLPDEACLVVVSNGDTIEVAVSEQKFKRRMNQARIYFAIAISKQYKERFYYPRLDNLPLWKSAEFPEDYLTD